MKRTSTMINGLLLGISLLFFTLATEAQTGKITFVSDTTWAVSDPAGTFLGFAQNVCLNASAPLNCPVGATLYSFGDGDGWMADLSSIPGATWIWARGITGATSPAFPVEFFFSKAFNLPGPSVTGTISVAADDFAEVFVNGMSVGTTGSVTDVLLAGAAQSSLTTFDITSLLVAGTNVITLRGANGPFGCGAGPYSCNPAGVVFGGSLQFQSAIPFQNFSPKVELDPADGEFEVKATFTLGTGSNGIVPITEIVQLELTGGTGSFVTTIPVGSFGFQPAKFNKKGKLVKSPEFKFEGVIDRAVLEVKITDLGGGTFEFKAKAEGANLAGIANPVTVNLTVGDDGDSATPFHSTQTPNQPPQSRHPAEQLDSSGQGFASRALHPPKPGPSIHEALRIAEDYVRTQKVDVSNHFIFSATLHLSGGPDLDGLFRGADKDAWIVTWKQSALSRYALHYVVVYMDKSVKLWSTK